MAGTPTPNYQFPTYAETDVPDLAGAYNQAVKAIDAKIKEVADTIPSDVDVPDATSTTKGIAKLYGSASIGDSTQEDGGVTPAAMKAAVEGVSVAVRGKADKFTATAPITYSGNKIGIRYSNPSADGSQNGYGAVQVTGKQQDVASADSMTTATVPNVKAVKDYVDAKVPAEQKAYTGTAPIVVNSESHAISVSDTRGWNLSSGKYTPGTRGAVVGVLPGAFNNYMKAGSEPEGGWGAFAVPSVGAVRSAIISRAPNKTNATTKVTVDMLKYLYVDPATGVVYYKAPTE